MLHLRASSWWVWSKDDCHHSRLVQKWTVVNPCRSLNTGPCFSSWSRTEIAAFDGDTLVENGAASATSGAAPSGVNPCPHMSKLCDLKGLSIRSDGLQLSKHGVGPVCVQHKFSRKRCWHTFVVNTQTFPFRECFRRALVENYTSEVSQAYACSEFTAYLFRDVSSMRLWSYTSFRF